MTISTLPAPACVLGEGAFWHPGRASSCWVDIQESVLYEYKAGTSKVSSWRLPGNVSFIAQPVDDDDLILGVSGGLLRFSLVTGAYKQIVSFEDGLPGNRCNDGGCDPKGRVWFGTMDRGCKDNAGSLYRVDTDGTLVRVLAERTIPNGIVWSLDHTRLYFIDTPTHHVDVYLFDIDTGDIEFERTAIVVPSDMGMPDGMAIDAEGMLWIALWNGACVSRWNPDTGELLATIELPALHVTNCAFTGEDLDSLLVTSAAEGLSPQQLAAYPESGKTFIISGLPVKGLPVNKAIL